MLYALNLIQLDLLNYKNVKKFSNFKYYLKFNQFKYILHSFIYSFFFIIHLKKELFKMKNILSFLNFSSFKYERIFFHNNNFKSFILFTNTNIDKQVISLINFIKTQKYFCLCFIKINKNFCTFNFTLDIINIINKISYNILLIILIIFKFIFNNFKNLIILCLR